MQSNELTEMESAIDACNAVAVPNPVKQALINTLCPIADRIKTYQDAANMTVMDRQQAETAATMCENIAQDVKAVKECEVLSRITSGLHDLHRRFTRLRDMFVTPLESYRKQLKGTIGDWEAGEQRKAAELQRKLQADADEKARRERERLLKKSEASIMPETKAKYQEAAAEVITPTINIQSPTTGVRFQHIVTCEILNIVDFVKEASSRTELCGYIDKERLASALKKARIANPMFTVRGVKFDKKTC